ncbi:MAG: hypothetical protein Q4A71_02245 [Actinomycetaceae bacterium]|nr:hypothetical protein [Actinomycetaceae bacterium]
MLLILLLSFLALMLTVLVAGVVIAVVIRTHSPEGGIVTWLQEAKSQWQNNNLGTSKVPETTDLTDILAEGQAAPTVLSVLKEADQYANAAQEVKEFTLKEAHELHIKRRPHASNAGDRTTAVDGQDWASANHSRASGQ